MGERITDRVAVTGATGFIGSAVVRQLLARGRDVRAIVEPGARTAVLDDVEARSGGKVERIVADVADFAGMRRALDGCTALHHLAALYKTWMPDPTPIHRVNLEGTTATLLAAQQAGVRRVVYTSSIAAVGLAKDGELANEQTPFNLFAIANDYILTKWQSERIALQFAAAGLPLVVVNPAFPFGERDAAPTPTGRIVLALLKGEVPGIGGGGFNCIDVEDVATGHLLAEEKGRVGERYILGEHNVTLRDFFGLVSELGGVRAPRLPLPDALSSAVGLGLELWADHVTHAEPPATYRSIRYAQRRAWFDTTKARVELGLPSTPLRTSIERAIRWFRAHGMA